MFKKITNWFKKTKDSDLPFELPIDEEEIFKKSKLILQQLDEYITASELESENLSIQLDTVLLEQETIRNKIKGINKPESWHERNLLLKLDRLVVHGSNLRQRVELFSQNIKVYLNLMSKVEDIRVMRLNGLETDKIQNIWLEFQHSLETYKEKIATEAVTETKESVTANTTEERLLKLRQQVFGLPEASDPECASEALPTEPTLSQDRLDAPIEHASRPSLEKLIINKKLEVFEDEDNEEDASDAEYTSREWGASVKDAVKRLEEE
jgi:hypothetical protein